MARIRTVKPDLARHEGLYEAERESGFPLRYVWAMLPTICDREGRFKWRPRQIKLDIMPYDDIDFSRVLDALVTRGFLVRYRVGDAWFGVIPTFTKHQQVNPRESASQLPPLSDADEVQGQENQEVTDASATREARVSHASPTGANPARGEGKGRERNTSKEAAANSAASDPSEIPIPAGHSEAEVYQYGKAVLGKSAGGMVTKLGRYWDGDWLAVRDTLAQAATKGNPREWIGAVLNRFEEPRTPEHILFPPEIYGNIRL